MAPQDAMRNFNYLKMNFIRPEARQLGAQPIAKADPSKPHLDGLP
jgi:hypothetical protein